MASTGLLKYWQLAWWSGPSCERQIYRSMVKWQPRRILEIGLGLGVRSLRLFQVAGRYCEPKDIQYIGVDLFEGRGPGTVNLALKDAYTLLRSRGVNVRLVPGDPGMALQLISQSIGQSDLIIVDSDISESDLAPAWKWMARIMHESSRVMRQVCRETGKSCNELDLSAVQKMAGANGRRPVQAA